MKKNYIILLTELAALFLMVFDILPQELALVITGLLVFYFIFSPLEDSLWVFIASIPLFVALPITESFDSMANWRILLLVLFLVWFFKEIKVESLQRFNLNFRLFILVSVFLGISVLSLLVADDLWIGVKKILFLVNAFLLFVLIKNISKIFSAIKVAIGLFLGIGFLQLVMVFFINLHQFWQFWARQVIPVFYGHNLSELLSYSNTWFSYYSYQLPTLRMFSVFPDSHSFAFFCILSLPLFLFFVFTREKKRILWYLLLIFCLLAIIFSGSRGAWASALGLFILTIFIIFIYRKKQIQLAIGSLVLFFFLFPLASAILFLPQYIQLGQEATLEGLLERARTIFDFDELSVKTRLEIWQRTADSIIKHPFLGVGIGNYPIVLGEEMSAAKKGASAHSLYLNVAAEIGLLGLLVLLAIFWLILKDIWRFFSQKGGSPHQSKLDAGQVWAGFFVLALVWILGYSLFDVVLLNDKVFLFFIANLGLFYAIKSSSSQRQSSHLERSEIY